MWREGLLRSRFLDLGPTDSSPPFFIYLLFLIMFLTLFVCLGSPCISFLFLFSSLSFPDLSSSFLPALLAICFLLAPSVPEALSPRLLTLTLTVTLDF